MRAFLLILLAAVGGWLFGYFGGRKPFPVRGPALSTDVSAARFGEVVRLDEQPGTDYDVVVPLTWPAAGAADGAVRVFFDLVDENNYLAAEMFRDRVRLCLVESGAFMPLAERTLAKRPDQPRLPAVPEAVAAPDLPETPSGDSEEPAAGGSGLDDGAPGVRLADAVRPLAMDGEVARTVDLRIRRRWPVVDVVLDGTVVLSWSHEGFRGGSIATGATPGIRLGRARIEPAAPIYFVDDFMRMPEEIDAWSHAGDADWEVRGMANPAKSANAFVYQGIGSKAHRTSHVGLDWSGKSQQYKFRLGGGISLTGADGWSDYQTEVSILGGKNDGMGLVLAATDTPEGRQWPASCAVVRWLPKAQSIPADKALEKNEDCLQLLWVENGMAAVIAEAEGGFVPGRWYRLAAVLADGVIRIDVDGRTVLEGTHPYFSGGRTGLYIGEGMAEFDDFRVVSREVNGRIGLTTDAAGTGDDAFNPQSMAWRFFGGEWNTDGSALTAVLTNPAPALAVVGTPRQDSVVLSGTVANVNAHHTFGLVASFAAPGDYAALEYDPLAKTRKLVRYRFGQAEVLDAAEWTPPDNPDESVSMTLTLDRGALSSEGLSALAGDLRPGRVGLFTGQTEAKLGIGELPLPPARFVGFHTTALEAPLPLVSRNKVFDEEEQMAIWSGEEGDWRKLATRPESPYDLSYWHRGVFFGDAEMEIDWPDSAVYPCRLALSLSKPWSVNAGEKVDNGYYLSVEAPKENTGTIELRRGDNVVASMTMEEKEAWPRRFRLRKAGAMIAAYLDDQPVLTWRDPEPMSGPKAAWASKGLKLDGSAVRIFSRSARDYAFNDAPTSFRVGGGVWEVTNRWECDPRWAFFTGMTPAVVRNRIQYFANSTEAAEVRWKAESLRTLLAESPNPEGKLVALWHKQPMYGDQAAEVFQSQMMFQGGNYARYVKNFCLTLCGDGQDVSSGYAFVFGGWDNTKSAILRNGKVVAEGSFRIAADNNIHRRWHHLRAEKRGDTVSFNVYSQNNRRESEYSLLGPNGLSFKDPEPLEGGQAAAWTYDAAVCLARMRLGAERWEPAENPLDPDPGASAVFYDQTAPKKP